MDNLKRHSYWEKQELPDGSYYEGDFLNGKFNGKGSLSISDVVYYEGYFVNGEYAGEGIYYYPGGSRFEGYFKKGETHNGILYEPDGEIDCKIKNGKIVPQSSFDKFMIHFKTMPHVKPDGMRLTRENYIDMGRISKNGIKHNTKKCKKMAKDALENFDLNMRYFKNLDKEKFIVELDSFLLRHPEFKEVFNLNEYENVPGYYIIVMDEYCQVYIGTTSEIKRRVLAHWSKNMSLDRLVFGQVDRSVLSIDSFRALDTTRIFAYESESTFLDENDLINDFPNEYYLNRTRGGIMEFGLTEAIANMKDRNLR